MPLFSSHRFEKSWKWPRSVINLEKMQRRTCWTEAQQKTFLILPSKGEYKKANIFHFFETFFVMQTQWKMCFLVAKLMEGKKCILKWLWTQSYTAIKSLHFSEMYSEKSFEKNEFDSQITDFISENFNIVPSWFHRSAMKMVAQIICLFMWTAL